LLNATPSAGAGVAVQVPTQCLLSLIDASSVKYGRLEIRVAAGEMASHKIPHRVLERGERRVVPGGPQPVDLGLGKILVARPDLRRVIDKFDDRRTTGSFPGRQHQILEAAGDAGAEVVEAATLALAQQPQHDRGAVLDIDEVARLRAIGKIGTVRLEQAD